MSVDLDIHDAVRECVCQRVGIGAGPRMIAGKYRRVKRVIDPLTLVSPADPQTRYYCISEIISYNGNMIERAIKPKTPPRMIMDKGSRALIMVSTCRLTSLS